MSLLYGSLWSDLWGILGDSSISLAFVIVLVCLWVVKWMRDNRGLPPGPVGLPYFGYLPAIRTPDPPELHQKLFKEYGDVVSYKILGGYRVVVCNTFDTVREAFVKQGDNVTSLPQGFTMIKWLLKYAGLEGQDGIIWREQRRYMLQTLRDFGFGKTSLEGEIHENVEELVQEIQKHANKPYDFPPAMALAAGNVVAKLFFSKKLGMKDSMLDTFKNNNREMFKHLPGTEFFRPFMLFGRFIPFTWHPKYRQFPQLKDEMYAVMEQVISEHEQTLDVDHPRDFIDMFLIKSKGVKPGTVEAVAFDRSQLAPLCLNMWLGGIGTTSDSMNWAIKLLALHPDIQRKVQEEIDDVIGRERMPTFGDNQHTPYTCATIFETMRVASLVPLTEYFTNVEEMTVGGYRIPKGSFLEANLYGVHRDPRTWENPDKFDPGHFLTPDGKLKKETLVAFFVGKRNCPGESLARVNLYIMFARLLQKFTFTLPQDEDRSLKLFSTAMRVLEPFKAIAIPRT